MRVDRTVPSTNVIVISSETEYRFLQAEAEALTASMQDELKWGAQRRHRETRASPPQLLGSSLRATSIANAPLASF
jgi:hypothetical protein